MVWNFGAGFSGVSFWNSMLLTMWNGAYTLPGPFLYGTCAILFTIWAFGGSYANAADGDPMAFEAICTSWTLVLESSTLAHLNLLNIGLMPFLYLAS
eukprot:gene47645-27796_t